MRKRAQAVHVRLAPLACTGEPDKARFTKISQGALNGAP